MLGAPLILKGLRGDCFMTKRAVVLWIMIKNQGRMRSKGSPFVISWPLVQLRPPAPFKINDLRHIRRISLYAEQATPAAYRIFWYSGPKEQQITIISITPHP